MHRSRKGPLPSCILLTAVIALLLGTRPALAQGVTKGVRAGVNIADLSYGGEDPPSLDPVFRLVAGAFATVPLTSWLELQPEVLYSSKGARLDDDGIDTRVLLDYLEVPVLARFSRRGPGLHYFFLGGPTFGVRLRAKARAEFSGATEEVDIAEDVERLDLGIAAGGGVEFGSIVIDARYTFGFRDIDKDKTDDVKTNTRVISLTAGFRF